MSKEPRNPADVIKDHLEAQQQSYYHEPSIYMTYCEQVLQVTKRPQSWSVFNLTTGRLESLDDRSFTKFFNDFMRQPLLSAFEIDRNDGMDLKRVRDGVEEDG
jgi:hypothetical protein